MVVIWFEIIINSTYYAKCVRDQSRIYRPEDRRDWKEKSFKKSYSLQKKLMSSLICFCSDGINAVHTVAVTKTEWVLLNSTVLVSQVTSNFTKVQKCFLNMLSNDRTWFLSANPISLLQSIIKAVCQPCGVMSSWRRLSLHLQHLFVSHKWRLLGSITEMCWLAHSLWQRHPFLTEPGGGGDIKSCYLLIKAAFNTLIARITRLLITGCRGVINTLNLQHIKTRVQPNFSHDWPHGHDIHQPFISQQNHNVTLWQKNNKYIREMKEVTWEDQQRQDF